MLYFGSGSETHDLKEEDLKQALRSVLNKIGQKQKVMVIPPDITRLHSFAGQLTQYAWDYFGDRLTDVMPALGTHVPMTSAEKDTMFGKVPRHLFRDHDWRNDVATVGVASASLIRELS